MTIIFILSNPLAVPVDEAQNKVVEMNEWLRISGFKLGEDEAATESPGTGTLIPSSPDSPRGEFAGPIPGE